MVGAEALIEMEKLGMVIDITHAALAIAAGTAICTCGAPFSAGALMLSRATGYPSTVLTWRWNGLYTLISMIILLGVYIWLEPGT